MVFQTDGNTINHIRENVSEVITKIFLKNSTGFMSCACTQRRVRMINTHTHKDTRVNTLTQIDVEPCILINTSTYKNTVSIGWETAKSHGEIPRTIITRGRLAGPSKSL